MSSKTKSDSEPITAIVIGAGNRGQGYAQYALNYPEKFQMVGVAEPRQFYRNTFKKKYDILDSNCFEDWKDVDAREKFADCVIITTGDKLHKDPAIAMAKKGYHILLEKPMAVTKEDCEAITATCKENNVILAVCHVLRYTPWAKKVRSLIDSGAIGDVVNINHTEPVGFWHFAHSYVRGNWRNEDVASFSLLAKCCHDIDLICYWMGDNRCKKVSSFGNLMHFKPEDKPKGAASRCMDCPTDIESECPYSAKRLYIERIKQGNSGWPVNVITEVPDIESVTEALTNGPYGRCVYECDNDVMSHQVVNMEFGQGQTATMTMVAFTQRTCGREVIIYGTKGEMRVNAGVTPTITVFDFVKEKMSTFNVPSEAPPGVLSGHGGADYHLIDSFVTAVANNSPKDVLTGPDDTLASHILVFAAEKSRKEETVVHLKPDGTFD
ncbi:hypothetical protein ScPMuIL_017507 [Solemya velum]